MAASLNNTTNTSAYSSSQVPFIMTVVRLCNNHGGDKGIQWQWKM